MSTLGSTAQSSAAVPIADADLVRVRRRTTWVLFASQIFGSGGTAASLAVAPILAASILGSSTWAGLPNSVRLLGAALCSIPLSAYMSREGRRRGLALGYMVGATGAAMSVLAVVWMDYTLLVVGSAVFGVGYAASLLSRYAAADVSPAHERGKAISLVVWGATIGAVVGPGLIGPSVDWAERIGLPPYSGAFLIGLVTFVVAALLLFVLLRPDPLSISRRMAANGPTSRDVSQARPLRDLLRIAEVQLALVTLMCSNLVMIGIMSMTPVYMHSHGHGLPFVGVVISAHVAGMYVFSPLAGWLADGIGRQAVIMMSVLTFIAAAVLNVLTPAANGVLIALGMFLIGLGWNLGFVAGSALLTDAVDPLDRPRLQGLADTWMGVAAAMGSLASGPILANHGFSTLNVVVALTILFPMAAMGVSRSRAVSAH